MADDFMTRIVPLSFADPRYLLIFASTGTLAFADEITEDLVELLQKDELIVVDLTNHCEINPDGEGVEIPHVEDLELEEQGNEEGSEEDSDS